MEWGGKKEKERKRDKESGASFIAYLSFNKNVHTYNKLISYPTASFELEPVFDHDISGKIFFSY